jgi:hypothetical protein
MRQSTLLCALLLTTVAVQAAPSKNAPADQYFGKFKMSTLRIRYEIMQLRSHYESHKLLPEEARHLATLDENAYYAWADGYPHDDWLPSAGLLIAQFYEELPGSDARNRAIRALIYVKTHFPKTTYGQKAAAELHRGVALRPDPAWAAQMRAARLPQPSPETSGSPMLSPPPAASPDARRVASPG